MNRLLLSLLAALLAAGCAGTSPPTHFYALETATAPATIAVMPELSLGLGPVMLPDTLDRPQIVSRNGLYRLDLAEFHRWAGDLKANLSRLLAVRLMGALGTDRVFLHPWARHRKLDYQVRVDILRYHGTLGGEAELTGTWTLLDGDGRRELYLEAFDLKARSGGAEYRDMVATLSTLAGQLADRVAAGVVGNTSR
jgi:uncharacterized lipoprotein YmbA